MQCRPPDVLLRSNESEWHVAERVTLAAEPFERCVPHNGPAVRRRYQPLAAERYTAAFECDLPMERRRDAEDRMR